MREYFFPPRPNTPFLNAVFVYDRGELHGMDDCIPHLSAEKNRNSIYCIALPESSRPYFSYLQNVQGPTRHNGRKKQRQKKHNAQRGAGAPSQG